jgi:hypothetical protein
LGLGTGGGRVSFIVWATVISLRRPFAWIGQYLQARRFGILNYSVFNNIICIRDPVAPNVCVLVCGDVRLLSNDLATKVYKMEKLSACLPVATEQRLRRLS